MSLDAVANLPVILFVPGHRPELIDKAVSGGSPAVVIDLEDAVSIDLKDQARAAVHAWFTRRIAPGKTLVGIRINSPMNRFGLADMARFFDGGVRPDFIVVPKVESAHECLMLNRLSEGIPLILTIESALGLARVFEIANGAPGIAALGFGGADLSADLRTTMEWEPLAAARAQVVQAAAAAGVGVVDVPWLDLRDESGLQAECRRARAFGFTGKFAIHPRHVAPVVDCFLPSSAEIARAQGMLAAADASQGSAVAYEGRMIDEAILRSARRIVALGRLRETTGP